MLLAVASVGALLNSDGTNDTLFALADAATAWVAVGALYLFTQSDWFAWQRTKPDTRQGASIVGLMLIAAGMGVLGGVIDSESATSTAYFTIRV